MLGVGVISRFTRAVRRDARALNRRDRPVSLLLNETSSAANVRRIEAITGPEAIAFMRDRDRGSRRAADLLRVPPERVADSVTALRERFRELSAPLRPARAGAAGAVDLDPLVTAATEHRRRDASSPPRSPRRRRRRAARARRSAQGPALAEAAIVLGRAAMAASISSPRSRRALIARGVKAGEIVKLAAAQVGGGGGGRDTMARAADAIRAGSPTRSGVALGRRSRRPSPCRERPLMSEGTNIRGYRSACACSHSTTAAHAAAAAALGPDRGALATPLEPVLAPGTRRLPARGCASSLPRPAAQRVLVGLPPSLDGRRLRSDRVRPGCLPRASQGAIAVPVELYDERFTTRMAQRDGGSRASEDSRAAARLRRGTAWLDAPDRRRPWLRVPSAGGPPPPSARPPAGSARIADAVWSRPPPAPTSRRPD